MIYTVTLNPSVDYFIKVNEFELGKLNRTQSDHKVAGGKGINVSRMLNNLGVTSKTLGFVGGFTGEFIIQALEAENISTDFIHVNGESRINIKLDNGETETEINGAGPTITGEELKQLLMTINKLKQNDYLVLAGSIQSNLPNDLYNQMVKLASERGANVIVDTSGVALMKVLEYQPFLVKPNHHELGEIFNCSITTKEEAIPYGKKLVEMGAQHAIVSMAERGALLFSKDLVAEANVPKGTLINSVGSGDSLVAGFLASYYQNGDLLEAFRYSIAAGSGTAFSRGLATKEKVTSLLHHIEVTQI